MMLGIVYILVGALAAGICLASCMVVPLWLLYIAAGVGIGIAVWLMIRRQRGGIEIVAVILFIILGYVRTVHDASLPHNDIRSAVGQSLSISGRVADSPVVKVKADGTFMVRYYVAIEEASSRKQPVSVSGNVLVYVREKNKQNLAAYGDRLKFTGEVRSLHGYRNPGRIDSEASWQRRGITARIYADRAAVSRDSDWYWQKMIDALRGKLLAGMHAVMPESDAAALFAMLFGGYDGIRPELLEAFTATGIVHILSVSGSHIALLAGVVQYVGQACRFRKVVVAVGVIGIVLLYSAFAGFVPPVIRSATMGILAFGAVALGRESEGKRILALTGLAMLLVTPQLLFDISFQLSFGATAGLIFLAKPLQEKLSALPKWVAANLALTLAAQLSVLPVLAWYFNSVSISSLLANFLVVPVVEGIIIIGLIGSVIGMIMPFLQNIFFVICSLGMGLVYNITSGIAAIPYGNLYIPSGGILVGSCYYVALGCWMWLPRGYFSKLYDYFAGTSAVVAVVVCAAGMVLWLFWRPPVVSVHFIDVGQGDAALVITARGKAVLIDTGGVLAEKSSFDVGARVVTPYLKHYGVTELEYFILTHAHDDHAGGAFAIYKNFSIEHIVTGAEGSLAYARFFKTSPANMPLCVAASHGQQFLVDGVRFTVFVPKASGKSRSGNEASNVVRIEYGEHSFLITGDLTAEGEASLIRSGSTLKSTVLKVAHHGSKSSSTAEFLAAVQPEFAVISVGADNTFGHPSTEVLKRLNMHNTEIKRTDQEGAIVFTTDGSTVQQTSFMEGRNRDDV